MIFSQTWSNISEFFRVMWEVNELLDLHSVFWLYLRGLSSALIFCIFQLQKEKSLDPEFIQMYPNLIARSSRSTYLKFQAFFTLVPFTEYYFFYRCFRYRFSTVAFLKDYAVPRKLFTPSVVTLSLLANRRARLTVRRKALIQLQAEQRLKALKAMADAQATQGYRSRQRKRQARLKSSQ